MIVLTYEKDIFGASGCFLADISLIEQMLSEFEHTDFKDGAIKAKEKIKELRSTHCFFWNCFCPIALLLNPQIEDIKRLLTTEEIEDSKRIIRTRMKKYPAYSKQQQQQDQSSRLRFDVFRLQTNENEHDEAPLSPIEKLIENRTNVSDLQMFWREKFETDEQQLAYVAFEILGTLITSVLTERSFSKSRYVINNLRTNISPENAKDQMIIKCNKSIAMEIMQSIDVMNLQE